jgi:hypothetical protein
MRRRSRASPKNSIPKLELGNEGKKINLSEVFVGQYGDSLCNIVCLVADKINGLYHTLEISVAEKTKGLLSHWLVNLQKKYHSFKEHVFFFAKSLLIGAFT